MVFNMVLLVFECVNLYRDSYKENVCNRHCVITYIKLFSYKQFHF